MKIALVGSAPSSIGIAPLDDKEWTIWACSPGAYGLAGLKSEAWFEIHRWEPQVPATPGTGQSWFSPEYCEFLSRHPKVYMAEVVPEIPGSVAFPFQDLIDKHGPFFFTSSLAWMLALAMEQEGVTEIGLFGVDMSAHEEYAYQRPGCQHFITMANHLGIKITVPPESDILQPPFMYGIGENTPMMIKLTARRNELTNRLNNCEARAAQAKEEAMFIRGALDDNDYMIKTWVTQQAVLNTTDLSKHYR